MAFRFRCHHCGQKIRAEERYAGQRARCPRCQTRLVIPDPGAVKLPEAPGRVRPAEPPSRGARAEEEPEVSPLADISLSPLLSPVPVPQPVRPGPSGSAIRFAYPQRRRIRVAVIGAGAVGCYYGAKLARIGHDVHFLMRRDLEAVRDRGLQIHSCDGDFRLSVAAHESAEQIGPADLVVCALKTTALEAAEGLVRPCVGPGTFIVALMNGLGVEEQFGRWFGPERIFGGLAFVCINRGEPGIVHHTGYGRVTFGHLLDDVAQARAVAAMFAEAGIETHVAESLRQARWEKLVWNVPFNSLSVTAGGLSTQQILDDEGLQELARQLMAETIMAGNACGCRIEAEGMMDRMFAQTGTMGHYQTSMVLDFRQRRPLEVEAILGEPVRQGQAAGLEVPRMEMQYHLVRYLDLVNRGLIQR
jgi:2-dehydropantoate 2-reductase